MKKTELTWVDVEAECNRNIINSRKKFENVIITEETFNTVLSHFNELTEKAQKIWYLCLIYIRYCNANKKLLDVPGVLGSGMQSNLPDIIRQICFHTEIPYNMSKIIFNDNRKLYDEFMPYFLSIELNTDYLCELVDTNKSGLSRYFNELLQYLMNDTRRPAYLLEDLIISFMNKYPKKLLVFFIKCFLDVIRKTYGRFSIRNIPISFWDKLYEFADSKEYTFITVDKIDDAVIELIKGNVCDNTSTKQFLKFSSFSDGGRLIKDVFSRKNKIGTEINYACCNLIDALIDIGVPEKDILNRIDDISNSITIIKRDYFSDDTVERLINKYHDGTSMNLLASCRPEIFSKHFDEYIKDKINACLMRYLPKAAKHLIDNDLVNINIDVDVDPDAVALYLSLKNLDEG